MATNQANTTAAPRIGRYEIDTSASTVTFSTRHLFGLAPVRGSFDVLSGTVNVAEPITSSSADVRIDAASFHTGNPARDRTVRSAHYLDTGRYPTMTFTSTGWDGSTLAGTLTVRGIAKPVSLEVEQPSAEPRDRHTVARWNRLHLTRGQAATSVVSA